MTMARYSGVVQDQAGNIITNAKIEVRRETPGAPLAALKDGPDGLVALTNPFNAESDGSFFFHAIGGFYKIRAYTGASGAPTFEYIIRYEGVGELQGYDLDAILTGKRQQVRVATTANITIATALNNGDSLDGVTLATSDFVLVKNQTAKAENGVYVVGASPARSTEFDTYDEHAGAMVAVVEGTAGAGSVWFCTANLGGTLNTTAIDFTELAATAGPPGADGEQGPPGPATIAIGTVTTLAAGEDATVTNSGDDENVILDFGIPEGSAGDDGADGALQSVVAGTNISVDSTDPANPVISASGGGVVETIVAGTNVTVDATDPANPIVSAAGGGDAVDIDYDNAASGLPGTNVQDAIDDLADVDASILDPANANCLVQVNLAGNGYAPVVGAPGFRNLFDNGDGSVFTRGGTVNSTSSAVFGPEGWAVTASHGVLTMGRSTISHDLFPWSVYAQATTADSSNTTASHFARILKKISGADVEVLKYGAATAKTVCLSFYFRATVTGTYVARLRNIANNKSFIATFSVVSTSAHTRYYFAIPGDTATALGVTDDWSLEFSIDLGSSATSYGSSSPGTWESGDLFTISGRAALIGTLNAACWINGLQLELGSTPTAFEFRPRADQLRRTRRYFRSLDYSLRGRAASTSAVRVGCAFDAPMIKAPTLTLVDTTPTFNEYGVADRTGTASTILSSLLNAEGITAQIDGFSSLTAGNDVFGKNGSPILYASCEV